MAKKIIETDIENWDLTKSTEELLGLSDKDIVSTIKEIVEGVLKINGTFGAAGIMTQLFEKNISSEFILSMFAKGVSKEFFADPDSFIPNSSANIKNFPNPGIITRMLKVDMKKWSYDKSTIVEMLGVDEMMLYMKLLQYEEVLDIAKEEMPEEEIRKEAVYSTSFDNSIIALDDEEVNYIYSLGMSTLMEKVGAYKYARNAATIFLEAHGVDVDSKKSIEQIEQLGLNKDLNEILHDIPEKLKPETWKTNK